MARLNKNKVNFDNNYDVIVLGFGGAGATAARFAADEGAKVLLVDSAPEGYEGGNTRYAAQMISTTEDYGAEKKYFNALTEPMHNDQAVADTFVEGMANMSTYLQKYLGVEHPYSYKKDILNNPKFGAFHKALVDNTVEYKEFPGSDKHDVLSVTLGFFDAGLWKLLRKEVLSRKNIDVWYSSPAQHLIMDDDNNVVGVQIEHEHVLRNIAAKNGVVLATGGFENNKEMIEDYLGASKLVPLGSLYNKGIGIKLGEEAGAKMWHMNNYESLGMYHGIAFKVKDGEQGRLTLADWKALNDGSVFLAGDDGSRYYPEDETNRHGHIYSHGYWKVPQNPDHPHIIFDQKQYDKFASAENNPAPEIIKKAIKADTLEELANKINANPEILKETVSDFNTFSKEKHDYAFHRDANSLTEFSENGPYYALAVQQTVLNTQGGPRRNSRAEVLDSDNQPIGHLYSAGELGGVSAGRYQAGENLAECLIFGKIAGQNAAIPKAKISGLEPIDRKTDVNSGASESKKEEKKQFTTEKNQYLGSSDKGMGDTMTVRVTVDDDKRLKNIEVLKQSESGIGAEALKVLPEKMIKENTYDVDAVSGASATSRALKDAVKNALNSIN